MATLEELRELAYTINRNKVKNIHIIGNGVSSKTKYDQFYQYLVDEKFKSEQEASFFFYKSPPNHPAYKRLKDRLSGKLLDTLFFIDANKNNFNEIESAYYSLYKDLAAIKILMGRNARLTAIRLAEQNLRKAIKFEFTDIILFLAKELRMHYGNIRGDKKKFKEMNLLVKKHYKILQAELDAEEYYNELILNYVNSNETKLELGRIVNNYSDSLRILINKYSSYRLNLTAFIVFILKYEIINDYHGTIRTCNEALDYFNSKKHLSSKIVRATFLFKKIKCFILIKHFEFAEKTALSCIELLTKGTSIWYFALEYYIILLFHSKQFQKSYQIFLEAIHHPRFKYQYKNISEQWKIFEAFIYYLILKQEIQIGGKTELKKFRLNKFLNEVPIYSKDKRGTNISILILQVLFLLEQKKYQKIRDRVEALQVYTYRYLRKDHTYRSNCFIKMLLQLPKSKFNKTAVERKVEKYKEKLQKATNNIANQSSLIEIVPYETLWEYVLDSLDNKFH